MKKLSSITFLLMFVSCLCAQIPRSVGGSSGTSFSGGSSYVWNGIPLTGVSFAQAAITSLSSASGNTTLLSNGSAKRYLYMIYTGSALAQNTNYSVFRTNGVYNFQIGAITSGAGNVQSPAIINVLEPGESVTVTVTTAAQTIQFGVFYMAFDASSPLKAPFTYGLPITGTNTVYTVPTGYTACSVQRAAAMSLPFNSTLGAGQLYTDASAQTNPALIIGGTSLYTPGSIGANSTGTMVMPPCMTSGTTVGVNLATGSATVGFAMPLIYERLN